MATLPRRPLSSRSHQLPTVAPVVKPQRIVSGNKRSRSPDPYTETSTHSHNSKRVKTADPPTVLRDKTRERKEREREQQKAEFKEKYTKAFPGFVFYFDELSISPEDQDSYEEAIERLQGKIVKFLDKSVSYIISNRPEAFQHTDKENLQKVGQGLKSPIKLKNRHGKDNECGNPSAIPAALNYKVWNAIKLESVLQRLLDVPPKAPLTLPATPAKSTLSLERLLKYEQRNGTTERDPTQKRHDFNYFARGSRFVLIEDIREELATIAVQEYPVSKSRDAAPPWPVLHCHPQSRGPFVAFDGKEKRRWERLQKAEKEQRAEGREYNSQLRQAEIMKRKAEASLHAKRAGDLRRSVSMNNLHRRATFPQAPNDDCTGDLEGDAENLENLDSAVASGFLFSASGTAGYLAASGNSVSITSTIGTTSTAGYVARTQLPSALSGRAKHVITSRKYPTAGKENKAPPMGPPSVIPERQPMLKKSRSTNTLKLPTREEGTKPGYCESCRAKFTDFKVHVNGTRHQQFATNAANFSQLDFVLARVQRRTKAEVLHARSQREVMRKFNCHGLQDETMTEPISPERGL
ncbi:hypothetical protein H0H92_008903 [Tricholoma furcatifolium]|nr:hypothetical protein H0H92_008903 [Tricholoma furcatifolium]